MGRRSLHRYVGSTRGTPLETQVPTAEMAIGAFLVGFVGDPAVLPDDAKWQLYDALNDASGPLGEVVAEIWEQRSLEVRTVRASAQDEHDATSPGADRAAGDPSPGR